eukprot:evm.model.NODE_46313_length_5141_cov_21.991636.1
MATRSSRNSSSNASSGRNNTISHASAKGGPTIQRVVDLLFETSRTAKQQLEEEHKENLGWLAGALQRLRARVLSEEMEEAATDMEVEACAEEQQRQQGNAKRSKDNAGRARPSKGTAAAGTDDEEEDNVSIASTVVTDDTSHAGGAAGGRRSKRHVGGKIGGGIRNGGDRRGEGDGAA